MKSKAALPPLKAIVVNGKKKVAVNGVVNLNLNNMKGGVQADWNQNDENAPDFIKNRICSSSVENVTLFDGELEWMDVYENRYYSEAITLQYEIQVGVTYDVTLNGTSYQIEAVEFNGVPAILYGNVDEGEDGSFGIVTWDGETSCILCSSTQIETCKLKIEGTSEIIKKIDTKYLPFSGIKGGDGYNSIVTGDVVNNIAIGNYSKAEGSFYGYEEFTVTSCTEENGTFNLVLIGESYHTEFLHPSIVLEVDGIFTIPQSVEVDIQNNMIVTINGFPKSYEIGAFVRAGVPLQALDAGSHAEGCSTIAQGWNSHTEGLCTFASNGHSHAEGVSTIASGDGSHAEGCGTIANGAYQHVSGQYNIEDTLPDWVANTSYKQGDIVSYNDSTWRCVVANSDSSFNRNNWENLYGLYKYAEIVGNGDYGTPSNARTLDWSGNESLAGTLRIGSTSTGGALLKYESGSLKVSFDDGTTWQTVTLS